MKKAFFFFILLISVLSSNGQDTLFYLSGKTQLVHFLRFNKDEVIYSRTSDTIPVYTVLKNDIAEIHTAKGEILKINHGQAQLISQTKINTPKPKKLSMNLYSATSLMGELAFGYYFENWGLKAQLGGNLFNGDPTLITTETSYKFLFQFLLSTEVTLYKYKNGNTFYVEPFMGYGLVNLYYRNYYWNVKKPNFYTGGIMVGHSVNIGPSLFFRTGFGWQVLEIMASSPYTVFNLRGDFSLGLRF